MQALEALSFRFDGEDIWLLDQTKLPQEEVWLKATDPDEMIDHIKNLRVRGAPLIGIAAATALARLAELGATSAQFKKLAAQLRQARPTAINLMAAIDRLLVAAAEPMNTAAIVSTAEMIFKEDRALCQAIADYGVKLIPDSGGVLTHCNTGGLATAGVGTALGMIRQAHEAGKSIHVFVDETRPLLQGGRLTTWELSKLGIPYTLIADNMAATVMSQGKVKCVVVGADRITLNGDVVNKVGTYGLAVLAKYHNIPFYVAAPVTTIDFAMQDAKVVPIEERDSKEIRGVRGAFGEVTWAVDSSPVFNPAFDVTPAHLVSAWIFDKGILRADDVQNGAIAQLKGS